MAKLYNQAFLKDKIIPIHEASLNIASSAVLYGLSVYTVFPIIVKENKLYAFRLKDHYRRLVNSAKIIGLDDITKNWSYEKFLEVVKDLAKANDIKEEVFVRTTIHVDELLPGTRSRGLSTDLSIFIYEAKPIVPQDGMRLKTSVWRRIPDYSIPSRAKVNGAYVNSVLAKQDALDSGYDDCIFLDVDGHVCELSAANIFLIKNNILITPDTASDLLEGINRRTVLELAKKENLEYELRTIDLTELYTADEIFVCGTSSYLAPVKEVDARKIGDGETGKVTERLRDLYLKTLRGELDLRKNMTELS
ncbi:MAG: aminotransferase class IV [Candidatus Paceibacterota bacterium]